MNKWLISLSLVWISSFQFAQDKAFLNAQELIGDRSYQEAAKVLTQLIQEYPKHPEQARWNLALLRTYSYLEDSEKFMGTVQAFHRNFSRSSYLIKVQWMLAEHLWKKEQKKESLEIALSQFQLLLSPPYQNQLAQYGIQKGIEAYKEKKYTLATQHFSKVLQLLPDYQLQEYSYYYLTALFYDIKAQKGKDFQTLETLIEEQLRQPQSKKTSFYYLKGLILLEKKSWEQARIEFFKFLKQREHNPADPDHPVLTDGYKEIGNSYIQQGFLKKAWEWYQKAIKESPLLTAELMRNMVHSAYTKGRYPFVIDLVKQFPATEDHEPYIYYLLGMSYRNLGLLEEAEQVFVEFLGSFPDVPLWKEVRKELPDMIFQHIQELWEAYRYWQAKAWIQKFVERFPTDERSPQLLFWEGERLEQFGYLEEAKKNYSLIEAKFPNSPFASKSLWNLISLAFEQTENPQNYQRYLEKLQKQYTYSQEAGYAEEFLNTQKKKFLKLHSPVFCNTLEAPRLKFQSKHVHYLTLRAYSLDIAQYLEVKKNLYFGELESITVDVVLPDPDKEWQVDLTRLENPSQIPVPFRTPGVYIVRALADGISATTILTISNLNVLARPTEGQLFLYAQDEITQSPLKEATITLFLDGQALPQKQTQEDGVLLVDLPPQTKQVTCLVEYESQVYFRTFELTPKLIREPTHALFAFTHQRIYSPGQPIQVYGWTRQIEKNQTILTKQSPAKLDLQLFNSQKQLLEKRQIQPDSVGFFQTSFPFSAQMEPGTYTLLVQQKEEQVVLSFVLQAQSPFDFSIEIPRRIISPVHPLDFDLLSSEASVANPIHLNYQVFLIEDISKPTESIFWKSENLVMTQQKKQMSLAMLDIKKDCQLRLSLKAVQGRKVIQSEHYFLVKKKNFYLHFPYQNGWSYAEKTVKFPFFVHDAIGWPLSKSGVFRLIQVTNNQEILSQDWETQSDGKTELLLQLNQPGIYRLEIALKEEQDSLEWYQIIWEVRPKPRVSLVWESPKRQSFMEQESIPLIVRFPVNETRTILTLEREQVLKYQVLKVEQGLLKVELPPNPSYLPEMKIRLAFSWKGEWIEEEFYVQIQQTLILGSELQKREGVAQQKNRLLVQTTKAKSLRFFAFLLPEQNVSSVLNREQFLRTFFRYPIFGNKVDFHKKMYPYFPGEENYILDQNLYLKGEGHYLNHLWKEVKPQEFQLDFNFPSAPGEYKLFLFAFGSQTRFDFQQYELKVKDKPKTKIKGPSQVYLKDQAVYTWKTDTAWKVNQVDYGQKASLSIPITSPSPYFIEAVSSEGDTTETILVDVRKESLPVFQVQNSQGNAGILTFPEALDQKQSFVELHLWKGLKKETQQAFERIRYYNGKDFYTLMAQLVGQQLMRRFFQEKYSPLEPLSKIYSLQNSDGSFGEGSLSERQEQTALVLYLFRFLEPSEVSFDFDVIEKALQFLKKQVRKETEFPNLLFLFILKEYFSEEELLAEENLPFSFRASEELSLEQLSLLRLLALQSSNEEQAELYLKKLLERFKKWKTTQAGPQKLLWKNRCSPYLFVFQAVPDQEKKVLFHWFLRQQSQWGFGNPWIDFQLLYFWQDYETSQPAQEAHFQSRDWTQKIKGMAQLPDALWEGQNTMRFRLNSPFPVHFWFVFRGISSSSQSYRRHLSEELYKEHWNQKLLGDRWFLGGGEVQKGGVQERWFVHLHLHLKEATDFLVLQDFLPAGARFVQGSYLSGPYQSYRALDHKILFFLHHPKPGSYDFIYPISWSHEGHYQTPSPLLNGASFGGITPQRSFIQTGYSQSFSTVGTLYQETLKFHQTDKEKFMRLQSVLQYPLLPEWHEKVLRLKMQLLHRIDPQEARKMAQSFSLASLSSQDHFAVAQVYLQENQDLEESHKQVQLGLLKNGEREIQLAAFMENNGDIAQGHRYFLNQILFYYPDFEMIIQKYFEIALEEKNLLVQFLAMYPQHPLAENATLELIEYYESTGQYEKAIVKIRKLLQLFPQNSQAKEMHYKLGYLLYETAQYEAALQEMRRFIPVTKEEPLLQGKGRLLLGKIYQVKGKYREAVEQFSVVPFLDVESQISFSELRDISLRVPPFVKTREGQVYIYPIRFRNIKNIDLVVYQVDLITLFERTSGFHQLNEVDLTGLPRKRFHTVELDALPYQASESLFHFKPFQKGAYLIYVANDGKLLASTIVIATNLKVSLSSFTLPQFGRRYRLHAENQEGQPIQGARIRTLNKKDRIERGLTDVRGIWDLQEVPKSVLIEYNGEYDFIQVENGN